jgi:hypothetical protein
MNQDNFFTRLSSLAGYGRMSEMAWLQQLTSGLPVNRQECYPDWLVTAIATLVTTKPLSASLQRVMAGMKYQI